MPYTLVVHIENSDPVVGETEVLPSPSDTMVVIKNPRRLDGKDIHYLAENVLTVYWPIERIHFIEVLSEGEEEEIIGFVRE
ncbi:MAG: hypothetical protein A2W35_07885 [Chloroflexi bacterium RBG_16_57_11]|nr:MAG: hypothetical protein A2W35_07885 [Chloroflexi bacterium RBG_16_57_11]